MRNPVENFGQTAKDLSRNPLGIIALFIVLVYGMAALVLGTTGSQLQPVERAPIIWFLTLFPVLVLLVFSWLVVKYPKNLYSPADYGTAHDFVRALTPEEQIEKVQEEVQENLEQIPDAQPQKPTPLQQTTQPRKITLSNGHHRQIIRSTQRQDLKNEYMVAESLVLRELAAQFGEALMTHAAVFNRDKEVRFDALVRTDDSLTGVEVKLFRLHVPSPRTLENIRNHALSAAEVVSRRHKQFKYLLAAVTDLPPEGQKELKSRILAFFCMSTIPIELVLYDLNMLKHKFGITSEEPLLGQSSDNTTSNKPREPIR